MAIVAIAIVAAVTGIALRRPPIFRMSCWSCMPWITEPGAEEQQRLEEGMGHQMEHSGHISGGPDREEHVPELADGGVGEDPLDVGLGDRDRGRPQGGDGADGGDDRSGDR